MKTVVLASGGTGGHIFPAQALAAEMSARGYRVVLFTDSRYDKYKSSKDDAFEVRVISSGTLGSGIFKKITAVGAIGKGILQARKALKELQPEAVIGFGGYPSFPTMYAATKMKLKTIIHEQNSMLGRANYVLASKVNVIATSFEEVSGILEEDAGKVRLTGNPVRNAVQSVRGMEYPDFNEGSMMRILVTGGSQGASVFSSVVPAAIALLPVDLQERVRIDQQCRNGCISDARAAYKEIGVSADLATFFNDLPSRLASCHLVISRSGASTLAEVSVAGRPVIMVPYPHAMDDHQRINANALEESGGGWVMPQDHFTPDALSKKIESFFNLPSSLIDGAERSKTTGRPNADKRLADVLESLVISEVIDAMVAEVDGVIASAAAEKDESFSVLDELESKG
jgi:UDP-N-acetylglucosamine--N-acetylmuramyl-(pentapeptide) pyrophosphoryl-undecaprenol N-acetylglucosamine transferase